MSATHLRGKQLPPTRSKRKLESQWVLQVKQASLPSTVMLVAGKEGREEER